MRKLKKPTSIYEALRKKWKIRIMLEKAYTEDAALWMTDRIESLVRVRTGIAMIFQHFNLLMQRSVLDNVCFPMEIVGVKKQAARKRAMELLEIVGLRKSRRLSFPTLRWTEAACGNRKSSCQYAEDSAV